MHIRIITSLFFVLFVSQTIGQTVVKTLVFDSLERNYRLHVPSSYDGSTEVPLVLNFHGLNSSAIVQELYTQTSVVSDSAGFIVVYPEGIDARWNVSIDRLENDSIDDVGFTSALIDTMIQNYRIDTNRIYSMGWSLGGFMSYRLACELSDRIAAITSVGGLMSQALIDICNPQRTLSITHIHGTDDDVVPYNGDEEFVSVNSVMTYWRDQYICGPNPEFALIPDTDPTDGSISAQYNYVCERQPVELALYIVNSGGHTWPGAFPLPDQITNNDFDASEVAWTFFKRHTLNGKTTNILEEDKKPLIEVYPNPTYDWISIKSEKMIEKASLFNLQGQKIAAPFQLEGLNVQADLSALPRGMYILEIIVEGRMQKFKVLKK